jgi:hypothetical protein
MRKHRRHPNRNTAIPQFAFLVKLQWFIGEWITDNLSMR